MKATGIVRRIDDLGRVVIPKEIRRTLRIREGDPLEIFVDRDGEVILKKYSPIGELGDFAKEYAESLFESTGHITLISDRDTLIAVAGASKKEYLDKQISMLLENCMEGRKIIVEVNSGTYEINKDHPENISSFAFNFYLLSIFYFLSTALIKEALVLFYIYIQGWKPLHSIHWLLEWSG